VKKKQKTKQKQKGGCVCVQHSAPLPFSSVFPPTSGLLPANSVFQIVQSCSPSEIPLSLYIKTDFKLGSFAQIQFSFQHTPFFSPITPFLDPILRNLDRQIGTRKTNQHL